MNGSAEQIRVGRFWTVVLAVAAIYALVRWGVPAVSRQITDLPFPLSVPGTLMFIYMTLAVVALGLLVTFSEEGLVEFMGPVRKFLAGGYGALPRTVALAVFPLLVGWQAYALVVPTTEAPVTLRIQHPSSTFPKSFEDLENPAANPTEQEVEAFIEQVRAGEVAIIEQLQEDVEFWLDEFPELGPLGFLAGPEVAAFNAQLEAGDVELEVARAALVQKNLFEGRTLYAMNCRACHGDSVSGDGPMADGFKLRPINFTDNGTIETIVEGYTFWRVANGGPGLPTEATPWDSAMPEWKLSLTDEQRWKIILAEYDLAEKTPRIPEAAE